MAYDIVFIQYGDKAKAVPAVESSNRNVEEPMDVAIKSNMELVAAASSTKVITSAEINVHYLADLLPGHESDIRELGRALASLMPEVHQLDCLGLNNNPIARLLFGHLAGCYTERLTKIKTNHLLLVLHDHQFTKIKDAYMNYDNGLEPHPVVKNVATHMPVKSFDTKLKVVGLGCDGGLHSLDWVAAVVKYLLLRIPTLDKLLVAQYTDELVLDFDMLDEKVTEFIEVYTRRYLHLESVSFLVDY
ncbi:hypothetical protein LPJ61_003450 [Coemansia biformis]|uniref:Uncharacterized protein n=1 Tax=Coemansia biformis TaxID=1286918 RepID=A0A9W7YD04_9FUNG|nr:hypothetical protein LPJ61_003450 [Coemansia biformis]